MYEQEGHIMKEKMSQVIEDWGRNVSTPLLTNTKCEYLC